MSTRGQSIAADTQAFTDAPHVRLWRIAAAIASLVLVNLVAIAAFLAASPRAHAEAPVPRNVPAFVTPGEMGTGALLFKSNEAGRYVEAPRLGTDIDLVVSGPIMRARVTQMFHNPTDGWVEAIYVFPLPEPAAVDTMKMVIGERIIVGEIKERQQARESTSRRKPPATRRACSSRSGRTSLPARSPISGRARPWSCRSNTRRRCASPAACSRCACRWSSRRATIRPRWCSRRLRPDGPGWGQVDDPVPDRARIEPPVLDPRKHAPVNPVRSPCACRRASRSARSRATTTRSR